MFVGREERSRLRKEGEGGGTRVSKRASGGGRDHTCSKDGVALFRSSVYMDMTIPGVQNPHWEPCDFASRS